jgi:hypothetical protein
MSFRNEQRCKICRSLLRADVDKMLVDNKPYKEIVAFCKKKGLDIGGHNLTRHKQRHIQISNQEIDAGIDAYHNKEFEAEIKSGEKAAVNKIVNANIVLEEIIARAYDGIINNKLSPSISDALKAVELKAKLREEHAIESTLIEFMMEFTRESDVVTKTTSVKFVKSENRPDNIVAGLEEISGARIRKGIDAENIAMSSEIETKNINLYNSKYKGAFEKTVDSEVPEPKQTVVQTSFLNIVPEIKSEETID